ncbi:hypothetical protein WA158_005356 [Blastocystis sp. Blastoise]
MVYIIQNQLNEIAYNDYSYGGNQNGGSATPNNSNYGSGAATTSPSKQKNYENQSLIPVNIKMIHAAAVPGDESRFILDGHELSTITLVASVVECTSKTTNVVYLLEDGTGRIEAKKWAEEGSPEAALSSTIHEGSYVRVFGSIKSFNQLPFISVFEIHVIDSFNEVNHHILNVIANHLKRTRVQVEQPDAISNPSIAPSFSVPATSPYGASTMYASVASSTTTTNTVQELVLGLFKQEKEYYDGAVEVKAVVDHLKSQGITEAEIREAIQYLNDTGLIYQTDDDHYKYTK